MQKHVSPNAAFVIGLFMVLVAIFYTAVITNTLEPEHMDFASRMWVGAPALSLLLGGCYAMIWSNIMRDQLKFDAETGEWEYKQR